MKIIAFDVGGTAIKFGLVDENFEVLFSEEFPTNTYKDTDNMVMRAMEAKLKEYEGQYDAIGISTAGQVDFANGVIHDGVGNIPNYNHSDLRGTFEKEFNVPVAVDNDV
ncbi:MAG: ROK family protein, partial [Clostridia bacterium]|nr:ROK family protein [Clostridia bacterium]